MRLYIFTPFGVYCGISNKGHRVATQNPVLEKAYHQYKHPDNDTIQALSKQTDFSSRHIERWFRIRRNQDKPTTMIKFTESTYVQYTNMVLMKPWLWDSTQCWVGYPHHHVPPEIFWYYMIEMGFYWSLMFSQFVDVKRKDFWEMFAHHCATLFLMFFSWSGNFVRVGTLVLVVHDAVDYWMEAAKMAKYCDAQKLCSVLFAIFGVVWFITRLVIYPLKGCWFSLLTI
ncbi:hypothetical protein KUTeg_008696 [Tegillarca granosa]|uniref:Homeobox domain-containing protein n=1 Tax=Tegillarca granosa TaxID=220873 RepID=A0ABQ9F9X1_TEGGR|nr:hypothetical protein KUTeg_008696 [Tegillarca granosa]